MKICDDCIAKLAQDLSVEAKGLLKNSYYLFLAHDQITIRDLGRDFKLSKDIIEDIIEELKSNFLLSSYIYNRRIYYKLTSIGESFIELEKIKEDDSLESEDINTSEDSAEEVLECKSKEDGEFLQEGPKSTGEGGLKDSKEGQENDGKVDLEVEDSSKEEKEDELKGEEREEGSSTNKRKESPKEKKNIVWNLNP